ncbi:hypothetical protein, partial [Zoogloea oleivorans]|uniref:hypothetical protein n=1 Tax=Zoogloea oleivorans TaxID=1552750 RepID=UPI001CA35B23
SGARRYVLPPAARAPAPKSTAGIKPCTEGRLAWGTLVAAPRTSPGADHAAPAVKNPAAATNEQRILRMMAELKSAVKM